MKKLGICLSLFLTFYFSLAKAGGFQKEKLRADEYTTSVTFPAGYAIGDYIEFVKVSPTTAGSSGYYEVSITYTRESMAAAATHIASVSHYNPTLWREVGRINNNGYATLGQNFTVDCNTEYGNARFRVRAINTTGVQSDNLTVYIKIRSINHNDSFVALNQTGNDLTVKKFLPMTNEWDLYIGNPFSSDGASIAIKALENGNVGIGTSTPKEKLSVNGKIRAHEIKVETANWPDYVFEEGYKVGTLEELERYIKVNKHLPEMPSAKELETNGLQLGEMLKLQQKKIEELILHLIEKDKELTKNKEVVNSQYERLQKLEERQEKLETILKKLTKKNN